MEENNLNLLADIPLIEIDKNQSAGNKRKDSLNFDAYAETIYRAIEGTKGPFTIGIFGGWGQGKTSLMRKIEQKIEEDKKDNSQNSNMLSVWFNAWQYELEIHPLIPLLDVITTKLEDEKVIEGEKELFRKILNSIKSALYATNISVGIDSTKLRVSLQDLFEEYDRLKDKNNIEKKIFEDALSESLYHNIFKFFDTVLTNAKIEKLIIFVDDLDRCLPEQAIRLLESIKLLFNYEKVYFVLGISKKVIEGYLKNKYEKIYNIKDFNGGDYLEKIIQLPFELPPIDSKIEDLIKNYLDNEKITYNKELKDVTEIISKAVDNNPRKIILFINNLIIDKNIYEKIPKTDENNKEVKVEFYYFAVTRALQKLLDKKFFQILRKNKDLRELLIKDKDNKGTKINDEKFSEFIDIVKSNTELRQILYSKYGSDWLKDENSKKRNASIEFILTTRQITESDYQSKEKTILFYYNKADEHLVNLIEKNLSKNNDVKIEKRTKIDVDKLNYDMIIVFVRDQAPDDFDKNKEEIKKRDYKIVKLPDGKSKIDSAEEITYNDISDTEKLLELITK